MWFKTSEKAILESVPVSRVQDRDGTMYVDVGDGGLVHLVKKFSMDMVIRDVPGTKYCEIVFNHPPTVTGAETPPDSAGSGSPTIEFGSAPKGDDGKGKDEMLDFGDEEGSPR